MSSSPSVEIMKKHLRLHNKYIRDDLIIAGISKMKKDEVKKIFDKVFTKVGDHYISKERRGYDAVVPPILLKKLMIKQPKKETPKKEEPKPAPKEAPKKEEPKTVPKLTDKIKKEILEKKRPLPKVGEFGLTRRQVIDLRAQRLLLEDKKPAPKKEEPKLEPKKVNSFYKKIEPKEMNYRKDKEKAVDNYVKEVEEYTTYIKKNLKNLTEVDMEKYIKDLQDVRNRVPSIQNSKTVNAANKIVRLRTKLKKLTEDKDLKALENQLLFSKMNQLRKK